MDFKTKSLLAMKVPGKTVCLTPSWSFSEAPRTNNISIEVSYTQRFGRSRVRGAVDRSSTNHLQRFEKK